MSADVSSPAAAPIWERLADRFNAILVKETRQALKSRQFVITFLLLLLAAWGVSVLGLARGRAEIEYGNAGQEFFYWFYIVLALATILVVPFGAYRSLLAERDLNTFDLLSITTLSPGRIVRGKLASAILQLFLFYSAITPFMAFASLLNGFDAPSAAYVLVLSLLASALLCMAALMFSTLARNRMWQGFLSLVVLAGLGMAFFFSTVIVYAAVQELGGVPLDADVLWGTGLALVAAGSYFVLFHQITVAQLTFDSDNRSTGVRLASAAQFWLFWIALGALFGLHPSSGGGFPEEMYSFLAVVCAIHWAVFGLFAVTEPDSMSHRVRRDLPRFGGLRFILAPFLPGGARGYLWVILHLAAFWVIVAALPVQFGTVRFFYSGGGIPAATGGLAERTGAVVEAVARSPFDWLPSLKFTTALCCYLLAYLGLGCALGRWLRRMSTEINAAHVRVVTFLILLAGTIFPFCLEALDLTRSQDYSIFELTSPIPTLMELEKPQSSWTPLILVALGAAAAIALVVNARSMIVETIDAVRPRRE